MFLVVRLLIVVTVTSISVVTARFSPPLDHVGVASEDTADVRFFGLVSSLKGEVSEQVSYCLESLTLVFRQHPRTFRRGHPAPPRDGESSRDVVGERHLPT